MSELQRPRPTECDDEGWVDLWIGLRERLRQVRRAIEDAASAPQADEPVHEAFGYALLGLVRISSAVDDQLADFAADALVPEDAPPDPSDVDLMR